MMFLHICIEIYKEGSNNLVGKSVENVQKHCKLKSNQTKVKKFKKIP